MKKFTFIVICILITLKLTAQTDSTLKSNAYNKIFSIELKDGMKFYAQIVSHDSLAYYFKTTLIDYMAVPITSIKEMHVTELSKQSVESISKRTIEAIENNSDQALIESVKGRIRNPHSTRYFFGPSAIPLQKGENYYQNCYLFVNSVSFGISNHFSMGGGLEILSPLAGEFPAFFITPKVGYKVGKNFYLGGGAFVGYMSEINDNEWFGIGYALATYGNENDNLTLGIGNGKFLDNYDPRPIITISGMTRLNNKFSLITENWIFSHEQYEYNNYNSYTVKRYMGVLSGGLRYFDKNFSFDFGLIKTTQSDADIFALPYIDIVFKF